MRMESVRKKDMQQMKATSASVRVSFSFIKFDGVVCSRICSSCFSIFILIQSHCLLLNFVRLNSISVGCRPSITHNVQGLLPWRTSNLGNVRRPSSVTYFKTLRGRAEPWQQADVSSTSPC